jgi:hypothetical protein
MRSIILIISLHWSSTSLNAIFIMLILTAFLQFHETQLSHVIIIALCLLLTVSWFRVYNASVPDTPSLAPYTRSLKKNNSMIWSCDDQVLGPYVSSLWLCQWKLLDILSTSTWRYYWNSFDVSSSLIIIINRSELYCFYSSNLNVNGNRIVSWNPISTCLARIQLNPLTRCTIAQLGIFFSEPRESTSLYPVLRKAF